MIKGVFLDLYETLVVSGERTATDWLNEFYVSLQSYGLSTSKEAFSERCQGFMRQDEPPGSNDGLTVYERRIQRFCNELGLAIDIAGIQRTAIDTIQAAHKNCYLDPDCHTVLETLQKRKTLALISNFDHSPHVKNMLRQMDLVKYFTAVIISEEVGLKKPDPLIFQLALSRTGLKAEEVIHVGDNIKDDIAGAVSAGIRPVLIRRNSTEASSLSRLLDENPAKHESPAFPGQNSVRTIRRLTELLDIV
jgi:HAD superfamily hydrolase (TIGR01549 family)